MDISDWLVVTGEWRNLDTEYWETGHITRKRVFTTV